VLAKCAAWYPTREKRRRPTKAWARRPGEGYVKRLQQPGCAQANAPDSGIADAGTCEANSVEEPGGGSRPLLDPRTAAPGLEIRHADGLSQVIGAAGPALQGRRPRRDSCCTEIPEAPFSITALGAGKHPCIAPAHRGCPQGRRAACSACRLIEAFRALHQPRWHSSLCSVRTLLCDHIRHRRN